MKPSELEYQLITYARKGGKTSRRRQVARIRQFLSYCKNLGVRGPDQIGKSHVWKWYEEGNLSAVTLRDRFYSVSLLWTILGRGEPPRPHSTKPLRADGTAAVHMNTACRSE